jgi:hypothetical protein
MVKKGHAALVSDDFDSGRWKPIGLVVPRLGACNRPTVSRGQPAEGPASHSILKGTHRQDVDNTSEPGLGTN